MSRQALIGGGKPGFWECSSPVSLSNDTSTPRDDLWASTVEAIVAIIGIPALFGDGRSPVNIGKVWTRVPETRNTIMTLAGKVTYERHRYRRADSPSLARETTETWDEEIRDEEGIPEGTAGACVSLDGVMAPMREGENRALTPSYSAMMAPTNMLFAAFIVSFPAVEWLSFSRFPRIHLSRIPGRSSPCSRAQSIASS